MYPLSPLTAPPPLFDRQVPTGASPSRRHRQTGVQVKDTARAVETSKGRT